MTLKEMKQKTFSLIEEYYPELAEMAEDNDVLLKINGVVNGISMELMPYKKIPAIATITITEKDEHSIKLKEKIDDLFQVKKISGIDAEYVFEDLIQVPEDFEGDITVYYYKYPNQVELNPVEPNNKEGEEKHPSYDDTFVFDLDPVLLEVMPYGIAADLLKMDMISSYGKYFYERYRELKQQIDSRLSSGVIEFVGGVEL